MKPKFDIISIGDPVIDSFLFIHDIEVKRIKGQLKAIINWGDKLAVDKFYHSVAGNGANHAIGSSRLGLKTAIYCVIAHDAGGREIIHKMIKEKVHTDYIMIDNKHGTNYHTALSYGGERTIFVFHEHRKYVLPKLSPSRWVYLTSMPLGYEKVYKKLVEYLDKYNVQLGFNPGTYQLLGGPKANKEILKRTALLSVNKEEAQRWVGGSSVTDVEELCKRLRDLGPKAIALTDGRKGAYSYSDEGFFYIPEFPGPRIESTGAGDSFTTAYIAALAYGKTHAEALRWGPVNAGSVVMHIGPLDGLLSRGQLESRLRKMKKYQPIAITNDKIKAKVAALVAKKRLTRMLVHIKELFKHNIVGQFAYPAFNTQNLETTMGIVAAAEELNAPVIMEVSEGAITYAGLETLYEIMATLAIKAKVPIALHMDHGKDAEQLRRGIELGFSSVMIDHSGLSFEENVRDTKAMVEFAHAEGAWVQGEIGRMRGSEDWVSVTEAEALLTDPEEALKFYEETRVDTLAASVGTIHGIIKMSGKVTAHVDVPRIQAIHNKINVPLVLHGASGVPAEVITQAIAAGIGIINIDTELRLAYGKALRQSLADQPEEVDPRHIMKPVIEAVKQAAELKLRQFGTRNTLQ